MFLSSSSSTASKILNSAEELFAQHGYAGVSLRQITVAAKVNLAAVNYHYYDKESLYRQILQLQLEQINRRRLALLAEAEIHAGAGPVPLPAIIDALARPLFLPDAGTRATSVRLLGRVLSERQPFTDGLLRAEFHPVMTRFGQAIRRHNPALPASDFVWRLSFVIGALHHSLVTMPDMAAHTSGLCRPDDCAGALGNFSDFAVKALSP
jgi:AcrR family transcriptional regulator